MSKNSTTKTSTDEFDEYPEVTQADFERAVLRKNFKPIEKLSLPEEFESVEEALIYWEAHSLQNYLDGTEKINKDALEIQRKWIPLERNLVDKLILRAQEEGVSAEKLVNLWIAEKLHVETR